MMAERFFLAQEAMAQEPLGSTGAQLPERTHPAVS
jgi:hypothetical protein